MLSADRQRFLEAVRASPADDVPRLVFADWLDEHGEPARAEFIRGQIRLSGLSEWDDGYTELDVRCRSLLRQHGEDWLGDLAAFVPASALEDRRWPVFRRGFPERVTVDVETFLQHADRLLRGGTVTGVWFRNANRGHWELYDQPALARLTAAHFGDWAFLPPWVSDIQMYESRHLAGLTELWLDHRLEAEWRESGRFVPADEISRAPFAAGLQKLILLQSPAEPYLLNGFNRLPALRELCVHEPQDSVDWRPATERAAWYHTLERLTVVGNGSEWTDGQLADIAGMPGLQAVAFENVNLSEALPGLSAAQSFWLSVRLGNTWLGTTQFPLVVDSQSECRVLDVSDNLFGVSTLGWIGQTACAPVLRVLRVGGCGRLDPALEQFTRGRPLSALAELDIGAGRQSDAPRVSIGAVEMLLGCDVCPKLVSLRLPAHGGAFGVASSPGSARLRELILDGPLDKAAAKALAGSPHLDALELLDVTPADRAAGEILRDRFGRRVRLGGG